MDGYIMRCSIISSCQSAATSEIVKRSWACVHRGAALYQVPDLYLSFFTLLHIILQQSFLFAGLIGRFTTHECCSEGSTAGEITVTVSWVWSYWTACRQTSLQSVTSTVEELENMWTNQVLVMTCEALSLTATHYILFWLIPDVIIIIRANVFPQQIFPNSAAQFVKFDDTIIPKYSIFCSQLALL